MVADRLKQIKLLLGAGGRPQLPSSKTLDALGADVAPDVKVCAEFGLSLAERQRGRTKIDRSLGDAIKVAVVSTWPPTACGIATFAQDVVSSLQQALPTGSEVQVRSLPPPSCPSPDLPSLCTHPSSPIPYL
jgi:hypothetical protein